MAKQSGRERGHSRGRAGSVDGALGRLLGVLRQPGDAAERYPLIAQHARLLMARAPKGAKRVSWMLGQLPEEWHRQHVRGALAASSNGNSRPGGSS